MAWEYERNGLRVIRSVIRSVADFVEPYGHAAEVVGEGDADRLSRTSVEKVTQVVVGELVVGSEFYLHSRKGFAVRVLTYIGSRRTRESL